MTYEYVDILAGEYAQRKNSNDRYSERAFAQSLGLSPGYMKLLFQGKKRLSLARAQVLANRLGWTELKKQKFLSVVAANSLKTKKLLKDKLILKDSTFFEISDWFHFAIIELIKVNGGTTSLKQVCSKFNLSQVEAKFALKNLVTAGLLETTDDKKYKSPKRYEMPSVSSKGIRKFHGQTLRLALAAIEGQSLEKRDLRSLTLAFDQDRLLEAKEFVAKFVSDFEDRFGGENRNLNSVYQLNLAFFRLDKEDQ